jgi:DNA polymerase-3 subunit delta'
MIKLCGNSRTTELTASMIRKGREPHSIIICGEHGLGKRTLARVIAMQLLCESGNGEPCGKCRQCRLAESGNHPDIITVQASETGNYKADDIRAVTSDAVVSPSEGRYKIYLIPDLDRSVQTLPQVQNILLKLIEEPPESAVIILTARSKEIFLDTIISRTVHLTAEEVTPAEAQAYLEQNGTDSALAEEAVRRCGGNIGQSLEYCENEKLRELAALAEKAMQAVAERSEAKLLRAVSDCDGKRETFITLIGYMQRIARDACRMRVGAEQPRAFSQRVCRSLSENCSAVRLADIYDILGDCSKKASANCSVSIVTNALTAKLFS